MKKNITHKCSNIMNDIDSIKIDIIDNMIDWIKIINKDKVIIYANRKMKEDLGSDIEGKKCYEVAGLKEPCSNCLSNNTFRSGDVYEGEKIIKDKIYSVRSSPIKNNDREIYGTVEIFRDITVEKELSQNLKEQNSKLREDIQLAENMQKRMLPIIKQYNGFSIDYLYKPSEMMSGDIFDIYKINDENTGIYICDVVGHGVTASLLTMFVRQSLRTISKSDTNINRIIGKVHKTFLALNLDADKYFSIFFGIYNNKTKQFRYINAGHNSIPILIRDNKEELLEARGYPICNLFDSVSYNIDTIDFKKNDRLLLYTDGIIEARDENGKEFGMERFLKIIKNNDILTKIETEVEKHCKDQTDDYTVLIIDVK